MFCGEATPPLFISCFFLFLFLFCFVFFFLFFFLCFFLFAFLFAFILLFFFCLFFYSLFLSPTPQRISYHNKTTVSPRNYGVFADVFTDFKLQTLTKPYFVSVCLRLFVYRRQIKNHYAVWEDIIIPPIKNCLFQENNGRRDSTPYDRSHVHIGAIH